jgi:signal transduction histidine kinase
MGTARILPVSSERDIITTLKILLLEDSPLDADLVIDWLQDGGLNCQFNCVQTRDDFVKALREGGFELILADYSLPGFDGIAALELAQELRPQIPFIFVSGYLGEDLAIETLKRGATDYVLKGRLERLLPSVERALREAKERDERRRIDTTLHILSQASLSLSSLDYETTLSHVARLAVPHFADLCLVDVVAEDGSIERVAIAHAAPLHHEIAGQILQQAPGRNSEHPIRQVLELKQSRLLPTVTPEMLTGYARDENHLQLLLQLGIESVMLVPLLANGQALGVMSLISCSSERHYDTLDLALAEDLARRCAMAIENARLHRKTLNALRARDEFLAVISHELRSPLTAILGWTHLLQDDELDSAMQTHAIDVIERNTKVQLQLIEDLLDVSRIITGRLRLEMKSVSVSKIIENVLTLITPTARTKGIQVELVNRAQTDLITGDEARLQQIFWNLVSNAIKFTPAQGQVHIELSDEDHILSVVVQDSGEGIDASFLPYVFDRFRQANSSSTRQHGGLGLGLSIVRHLSEMHAGTVEVHSGGPGQGASFTVKLPFRTPASPLADVGEKNPELPTEIKKSKRATLEGRRILLVEDGEDARHIIATILRHAGANVTAVSCAADAMKALRANPPEVLISDIGMPTEDGYSLRRRVKEWESQQHQRIPAIALTAYASEKDRQLSLAAGFELHLTKPIEPDLLISSIDALLSRD